MKKVLSFVLVLALVLGSFSMAFAAVPTTALSDVTGNANEKAINVLYNLGVVTGNPDGTFLPAKEVNRAEFAAMITRAMAVPASALAGYTATTFKDTAGYQWAIPYLAFCETKGIILGDGQGNVMPGRTISVNEAMTMVLRAVGYTNNSNELIGAWPSNYVSLAQNLDLYDKVAAVLTVDKANAAQVLYNALTVTKVVVAADGATTAAAGGKSLLTGNLSCTKTTDYIIKGTDYADTLMDINAIMGARGTVFKNKDGDIVAFKADSKALYGKVDGDYFVADGVKYTVATTGTYATGTAIYNTVGQTPGVITLSGISTAASSANDDEGNVTVYADVSGTTINKVYSVVAWKATADKKVASADLTPIKDSNEKLLDVEFVETSTGTIDLASFSLVGAANLDAIAKDNVVYVYRDATNIRKIVVGTTVVSGKVTTEKDNEYVYVNGTKYEPAKLGGNLKTSAVANLGETVKMYLDGFGKVYSYTVTSGTVDKYGVVLAYSAETSLADAKAKVWQSDDTGKIFTFVAMADLKKVSGSAFSDFSTTPSLIGYGLDANGKIETLNSNIYKYQSFGDVTASYSAMMTSTKVLKVSGTATTYFSVADDAVLYTYDMATSKAAVSSFAKITLNSNLINTTGAGVQFVTKDGVIKAMLVNTAFASVTDTTDAYGIITSYADVRNADDTATVQTLDGFFGTTAFTGKLTNGTYVGSDETTVGAVVAFKINASGVVTDVTTLAAYQLDKSHYLAKGVVLSEVNDERTVLTATSTGIKYAVASDAIVYKVVLTSDNKIDYYEKSSLTSINTGKTVWLYDTKGENENGIASFVVFK